jgi:hypothetical protein
MKKSQVVLWFVLVALLGLCIAPAVSATPPGVNIKVLNPPPKNRPLQLAVDESYTFDIRVESEEPFDLAMGMMDAYYPGRGVFSAGGDRAAQSTSALLHLTITGKNSTADLYAVCDWPEPGICWPEGVAPLAIVVGVRLGGGQVVADQTPFSVVVP